MKKLIVAILIVAMGLLPAGLLSQGLPAWNSCHNEVAIRQEGDKIFCVYDEGRCYQYFTYYVRSYGGAFVCKIDVTEIRHEKLGDGAAKNSGLRNLESLRKFYRVEYSNNIKTQENGVERASYIEVLSGPDGVKIEVMTFIPITAAPVLESDSPSKEASL